MTVSKLHLTPGDDRRCPVCRGYGPFTMSKPTNDGGIMADLAKAEARIRDLESQLEHEKTRIRVVHTTRVIPPIYPDGGDE